MKHRKTNTDLTEWIKSNWIIVIIIGLSITLIVLLVLSFINFDSNYVNFYLALSTIISSLLIVITLSITIKNNYTNMDNFIKAQEESKRQFQEERNEIKVQFEEQQKFLRVQQFETTFFNMMNQLEDIVSKLSIENINGREVFQYLFRDKVVTYLRGLFFNTIEKSFEDINKEDTKWFQKKRSIEKLYTSLQIKYDVETHEIEYIGQLRFNLKEIIENFGIKGYEEFEPKNILDHYFRYIYRIMKFIDEAKFLEKPKILDNKRDFLNPDIDYVDERYKYMGILRATLSPYELVLLFYNDLSKYGNEKVKPLIEKYSMFKSLRPELLANIMRDYELNLIEDEYK